MHVFGPKQPRNRKTPGTGFFLEVVKQGFRFGLNAAVDAAELRFETGFRCKEPVSKIFHSLSRIKYFKDFN